MTRSNRYILWVHKSLNTIKISKIITTHIFILSHKVQIPLPANDQPTNQPGYQQGFAYYVATCSTRNGNLQLPVYSLGRSQWPSGLRHRSAVARLLGSQVRIPLGAWMSVSCVYMLCCPVCRGLCDGLITRPEESYRVSNCVWLRNLKGGGQGPIWAVAPLDGWHNP
jgi:hypothetical protein